MSTAAIRSNEGDAYQIQIGIHWLIKMLGDSAIDAIECESTGGIDDREDSFVDDIVVRMSNGRFVYSQAKKNEPGYKSWKLSTLRSELVKAHKQISHSRDCEIYFFSWSTFGEVAELSESCNCYCSLSAFQQNAGAEQNGRLNTLAQLVGCTLEDAFALASQLRFGDHRNLDSWIYENRHALERHVAKPDEALFLLQDMLQRQSRKDKSLDEARWCLTRQDVIKQLASHGHVLAPPIDLVQVVECFARASQKGRQWQRDIEGQRFNRSALANLKEHLDNNITPILLVGKPGSGKTCVFLDLIEVIEADPQWYSLFLRGDHYLNDHVDFGGLGRPHELVGKIARLATQKHVLVAIDSLDVLAANRDHKALSLFLDFIDQLTPISGVYVVTACRDFDQNHDLTLKSRTWKGRVDIGLLDTEQDVIPLLAKFDIARSDIQPKLIDALSVPQNLRLFLELWKNDVKLMAGGEATLYHAALRDLDVRWDGPPPLPSDALKRLATMLAKGRTVSVAEGMLPSLREQFRYLGSAGWLEVDQARGMVGFSHQTRRDYVLAKSVIDDGSNLIDFVIGHHQHPFIRPALRLLLVLMRELDLARARREIRAFLISDAPAYHFKRLVCETIAEYPPESDDNGLIRDLFARDEDVFRCFFFNLRDENWLGFLKERWLPLAKVHPRAMIWLPHFCTLIGKWLNTCAVEVIGIWTEALHENWPSGERIRLSIVTALEGFESWSVARDKKLLESLIEYSDVWPFFREVLSKYVEETGDGDELLWKSIIRDIPHKTENNILDFDDKFYCNEWDFHRKGFLVDRLQSSDKFLSLAVDFLYTWHGGKPADWKGRFHRDFLHSRSWNRHRTDSLAILLSAVRTAAIAHAQANSSWWQTYEPKLRSCLELGLRHVVIECYMANIDDNIAGITTQLTDKMLLRYGSLDWEISRLMNAAYPFLPDEVQNYNQLMILALFGDEFSIEEQGKESWVNHKKYSFLVYIPTPWCTPETLSFLEQFRPWYGFERPIPRQTLECYRVISPVSSERMQQITDRGLVRLLLYYTTNDGEDRYPHFEGSELVSNGGRDDLSFALSRSVIASPLRYLGLIKELQSAIVHDDFINSIFNGAADHIKRRHKANSPQDHIVLHEPLPDSYDLALCLLAWVEDSAVTDKRSSVIACLEACCYEIHEGEALNRLINEILRFEQALRPLDDEPLTDGKPRSHLTDHDLIIWSAMTLSSMLLDAGEELPTALIRFLYDVASSPDLQTRLNLLRLLPVLISRRPLIGLDLLDILLSCATPVALTAAEPSIYYSYYRHIERVQIYIDHMLHSGSAECAEAWGRLASLCHLSGHLSFDELLAGLAIADQAAWRGVVDVFAHNLDGLKHGACLNGLRQLFRLNIIDKECTKRLDHAFGVDKSAVLIDINLACSYIAMIPNEHGHYETIYFFPWLEKFAEHNPWCACELLEVLARRLEIEPGYIHDPKSLVSILHAILREADQTGKPSDIRRAISLQDQFLRLNIKELDNALL